MKLIRVVSIVSFALCYLLQNESWAGAKNIEKMSRYSVQCSAEYLKEYEQQAKQEVLTYSLGERYRANLIEFISLLHQYKRDSRQFCHYSSSDYLALLWKATNTLKLIRDKRGPFPPDTFGALAESRLNRLWNDGFKLGWNGFPKNSKQLQCLQKKSVLQVLEKCERLNVEFFAVVRATKMPEGWGL
jgi:hypothetical protein